MLVTYINSVAFQAFKEIQKLLIKTNGQVIGDVMTPSPLVVRELTNLEDAARYTLYPFQPGWNAIQTSSCLVKVIYFFSYHESHISM